MYYSDDLVAESFVDFCESVGNMFLTQFIRIDSFWMGVYILVVLIGCFANIVVPAGGKKHVR